MGILLQILALVEVREVLVCIGLLDLMSSPLELSLLSSWVTWLWSVNGC